MPAALRGGDRGCWVGNKLRGKREGRREPERRRGAGSGAERVCASGGREEGRRGAGGGVTAGVHL